MLVRRGTGTKLDSFYFSCDWCRLWHRAGVHFMFLEWMAEWETQGSYPTVSFPDPNIALCALHSLPGKSFPLISNFIFIYYRPICSWPRSNYCSQWNFPGCWNSPLASVFWIFFVGIAFMILLHSGLDYSFWCAHLFLPNRMWILGDRRNILQNSASCVILWAWKGLSKFYLARIPSSCTHLLYSPNFSLQLFVFLSSHLTILFQVVTPYSSPTCLSLSPPQIF